MNSWEIGLIILFMYPILKDGCDWCAVWHLFIVRVGFPDVRGGRDPHGVPARPAAPARPRPRPPPRDGAPRRDVSLACGGGIFSGPKAPQPPPPTISREALSSNTSPVFLIFVIWFLVRLCRRRDVCDVGTCHWLTMRGGFLRAEAILPTTSREGSSLNSFWWFGF